MKLTNTDKGTDILSGRGSKTDAKVTERSLKDTVITNNRTDQFPDVFSLEKETGGSIRTTVHASRETMDKKINEKEKENVGKTINVRMNSCTMYNPRLYHLTNSSVFPKISPLFCICSEEK